MVTLDSRPNRALSCRSSAAALPSPFFFFFVFGRPHWQGRERERIDETLWWWWKQYEQCRGTSSADTQPLRSRQLQRQFRRTTAEEWRAQAEAHSKCSQQAPETLSLSTRARIYCRRCWPPRPQAAAAAAATTARCSSVHTGRQKEKERDRDCNVAVVISTVRLPQTKKVRLKKSSRRHEMPMQCRARQRHCPTTPTHAPK